MNYARCVQVFAVVSTLSALAAPRAAFAGDEEEILAIVLGGSVAATAGASAIAFTAYSGGTAARLEEPDQSWMAAQAIAGGAEALVLNGVLIAVIAEDDDEGVELLPLPFAIWTNSIATFGVWSVGAPGTVPTDARFGVSWFIGANTVFTTAAFAYAGNEKLAPIWMALPQVAASAPQAVFATIRAAQGEQYSRPGWIALSAWSGLLTIHGTFSIIGAAAGWGDDDEPVYYPDIPPPPDPPRPPDPYYLDPVRPLDPPRPPPPPFPPGQEAPQPMLIPAPVPDAGGLLAPGLAVVGVF